MLGFTKKEIKNWESLGNRPRHTEWTTISEYAAMMKKDRDEVLAKEAAEKKWIINFFNSHPPGKLPPKPPLNPIGDIVTFYEAYGENAGWPIRHHEIFLRSRKALLDDPFRFIHLLSIQIPDIRASDVASHWKWQEELEWLKRRRIYFTRDWDIAKSAERGIQARNSRQANIVKANRKHGISQKPRNPQTYDKTVDMELRSAAVWARVAEVGEKLLEGADAKWLGPRGGLGELTVADTRALLLNSAELGESSLPRKFSFENEVE